MTEQDRIRVTVELERNPLPAGEPVWAISTVTNLGKDDVTWFHDGCFVPVSVFGEMVGARWRPGIEQSGPAGILKDRLIDGYIRRIIRISFTPDQFMGRGQIGCADVGMVDTIAPGRSIEERSQWNGMADYALGPPPNGPVALGMSASFFYRGEEPEDMVDTARLTIEGDAWIVGGKDSAWLDPPEIVDAALADAGFVAWLADKPLGYGMDGWIDGFIRFDLESDLWEVGTVEADARRLHYVRVDPIDGSIIETKERPWVREVDGI